MATAVDASGEAVLLGPFDIAEQGKKTVLHRYCMGESRKEKACVFLCIKSGPKVFVRDVPFDPEDAVIILKEQLRLWDRLSLFGPVAVRHVEVKFLSGEKLPKGFEVVILSPDRTPEIARTEQTINNLLEESDHHACGVTVDGKRHEEGCDNECYDELDNTTYCPVTRARQLRLRIDLIRWTPSLLNYFWQHRAQCDGISFLKKNGFVYHYKALAVDQFADAEEPYGRSINAIELVYGWKIQRVLWTVMLALVCDICIVAVATLLTHSLEGGLAAGSCAAAMQAIPIALLTMLSAVLA